jgi:hypothetical protein
LNGGLLIAFPLSQYVANSVCDLHDLSRNRANLWHALPAVCGDNPKDDFEREKAIKLTEERPSCGGLGVQ